MRALLAGLLASAVGAPGRDIPVYREYSQPISFYDDNGEQTDFASVAPDVAELRSVRDAQAQEALMGKETLLEMTFAKSESVFGPSAPLPGKLTPPANNRDDGKRRSNSAGQNWLAKSLTLPSLGQKTTNAAASAMSTEGTESGWGWLADEVVGSPGLEDGLPEELRPEDGYDPGRAQNQAETEKETLRGSRDLDARGASASAEFGSAAADRERFAREQSPADQAKERRAASDRDLAGGDGMASPTRQSYRASSAVAELSQTRQVISEFSAGARPDFAALRESLLSSSPDLPSKAVAAPAGPSSPAFTTGQSGGRGWGASGSRPAINSGSSGYASPGASAWQGSWRAQSASASRMTDFQTTPSPIPEPMVPSVAPVPTRSSPPSGGYKPAWH